MKKLMNPTKIGQAQVTFLAKGRFSAMKGADKISVKVPWLRKPVIISIPPKLRKSQKRLIDFIQSRINELQARRESKSLGKHRRASKKLKKVVLKTTEEFDPFDVNEPKVLQPSKYYIRKGDYYVHATKIRYSFKKQFVVNRKNAAILFKAMVRIPVMYASHDFFFQQNGYSDFFQLKLDFNNKYTRFTKGRHVVRNGVREPEEYHPDDFSFSRPRVRLANPDTLETAIKKTFESLYHKLVKMRENYLQMKFNDEDYTMFGFTIEHSFMTNHKGQKVIKVPKDGDYVLEVIE